MTTNTQWSISGTYCEACNCEVACPCVFLSPPTTGECTVLIGWHIERGNFGEVSLNGLNVGLAIYSPGPMLQVQWKAALYLDQRSNQAQQDALTQIFGGQAGGHFGHIAEHIGEVVGVKTSDIEYQAQGKRRVLRIAGAGEVDMEAIDGVGGNLVTISNNPLGVVPGEPVVVAKSGRMSYHDHGMNWEITDRNGYYSPFTYQGP